MRQKRLDVDPPGPPGRDPDQSELIMQNVEDQHHSHQIGRREVSSNIHQTAQSAARAVLCQASNSSSACGCRPISFFVLRLAPGGFLSSRKDLPVRLRSSRRSRARQRPRFLRDPAGHCAPCALLGCGITPKPLGSACVGECDPPCPGRFRTPRTARAQFVACHRNAGRPDSL